jgi:glycosyltransferase involved in cell wall biosynthesis
VLHLNEPFSIKFAFLVKTLFSGPIVLTLHGNEIRWPYAINSLRPPDDSLQGIAVTRARMRIVNGADHVICVNPMIRKLLISRGVPATKISVNPAYLPPTSDETAISSDKKTSEFIVSHWPIISANAYQITFYEGRDLYGLDTSIELCNLLRQRYPHVGFLFSLPAVGEQEYLHKMCSLIAARRLEDNFLFVIERPEDFYAILRASTVFIRPTLTDGDALSIREALHFGVPAIASDVSARSEGTLLYKVGDLQNLCERVIYAIEHRDELHDAIVHLPEPDYFRPLLNIYCELAAGDGEI